MPLNALIVSYGTGAAALSLATLFSIPAIRSVFDRIVRKSSRQHGSILAKTAYTDEDGEATEESLRAFQDQWQRVAIAVFSASGMLVTLALAVLLTIQSDGNDSVLIWVQFGIWVWS